MNDERMSDHDEETKSRLRWTEARRAGGHAFPAPSRVDSTSRAGAWCPPRRRRARRRRHIGGARGAAGPGAGRAAAAAAVLLVVVLLVAVVVLVAVAVPRPPPAVAVAAAPAVAAAAPPPLALAAAAARRPRRSGGGRYFPRSGRAPSPRRRPGAAAAGHYGPGGGGGRGRSPEPFNPRRGPPRRQRGPSPASRAAMKQIADAAKQGTGGVGREKLKSLTAGSKAPRNVPADPPNTLVEERNCTFEPAPAPAPARRPRAEVGAASRRKFGLLGKTLAAAKADTSRDKLGGDLGKLPPAAQRALRARIVRGALRPSEVTRDAALFGELCAPCRPRNVMRRSRRSWACWTGNRAAARRCSAGPCAATSGRARGLATTRRPKRNRIVVL